jgi:hypothetical protein
MLDLLQSMCFGRRVTAYGKQWIVVYVLPGNDACERYLAVEESVILPAPISFIIVPRALQAATPAPATPAASPG